MPDNQTTADVSFVEPTVDEIASAARVIRRVINTKMDIGPKECVNPGALCLAAYLLEDGIYWRELGLHKIGETNDEQT
jgi:hypothetical protein